MRTERRILVVEDSATQAQRVQLVLEEAGYRVDLALNGREAMAKVRASPPDMPTCISSPAPTW